VKVGTYTGNGTTQSPSGVGFTPKVVIAWCNSGNGNARVRVDTMSGDESVKLGAAGGGGTQGIKSIDSDGFTVGTSLDVNENTVRCDYVAFAGTSLVTVTWQGDGNDNRDITTTGVNPNFVFIAPSSGQAKPVTWRGASPSGDKAFHPTVANAANWIQTLGTAKFTIGNDASVNNATGTPNYYAFAIEGPSSAYTTGTYAGNSIDDRNITATGVNPIFAIVKIDGGAQGTFRTNVMSGDTSKRMYDASYTADDIQSVGTATFQVGASIYVNQSGFNYYWWVFNNETAATSGHVSVHVNP